MVSSGMGGADAPAATTATRQKASATPRIILIVADLEHTPSVESTSVFHAGDPVGTGATHANEPRREPITAADAPKTPTFLLPAWITKHFCQTTARRSLSTRSFNRDLSTVAAQVLMFNSIAVSRQLHEPTNLCLL
jgi:hypothetical protein